MTKPVSLFGAAKNGWRHICQNLTPQAPIALFLDYDGTVVPIRREPSLAVLANEVRVLLHHLAEKKNVLITIVTGRSLKDIQKLVRLTNIDYIGNHGFEMSIHGKTWVHPAAKRTSLLLHRVLRIIQKEIAHIKGVQLEDKRYTLSVHVRNASPRSTTRTRTILEMVLNSLGNHFILTEGKKVFEIRHSVVWNKGKAVHKLLRMKHLLKTAMVLYIGDDATDEDAFHILPPPAVTIRVGMQRTSAAQYYLKNQREVLHLLQMMSDLHGRNNNR